MSEFPKERNHRNDSQRPFFCSQCQSRAKRRRRGGPRKGKLLPIPPELPKGDSFSPFHEVHDLCHLLDTVPLRKQSPQRRGSFMGRQSEPETLLRFPALLSLGMKQ